LAVLQVDPSIPSALRTLSSALQRASAGDTILVASGIYRENLTVLQTVEIHVRDQGKMFSVVGSLGVKGSGVRLVLSGCLLKESADSGLTVAEGAQATVSDCTFSNHRNFGIHVLAESSLEATRCSLQANASAGIFVYPDGSARLEDCVISGNGASGVAIGGGASASMVRVDLHENSQNGLWLNPGARATLDGCVIHRNTLNGIGVQGAHLEASKCKVHGGLESGISLIENATGTIDGCEIHNNASRGIEISASDPLVTRSKVHSNGRTAIFVHEDGRGTIEDCEIWGGESREYPGITINGSTTVIRNCRVHDTKSDSIFFRDSAHGLVEDTECWKNAEVGINIDSQSEATVRRCKSYENEQNGILIQGGAKGILEDCEVWGGGESFPGVTINAAQAEMRYCRIHDNKSFGVYFRDKAAGTIEKCESWGNSGMGISIDSGSEASVHGTKCYENGTNGILVSGGANGTIEDCEVWGGGQGSAGIEINSAKAVVRNTWVHDTHGTGLLIGNEATGVIEDCDCWRNLEAGIQISGQADVTLLRTKSHGNLQNAIFVSTGGNGTIEDCELWDGGKQYPVIMVHASKATIRKCRVHDSKSDGILYCDQANGVIEDTECWKNSGAGISINSQSEVSVRGIKSHDNSQNGLVVLTGGNGTIEDSEFWKDGNNYAEILIDASKAMIRACRVHDAGSNGILFRDHATGVIDNSECWKNSDAGISIDSQSEVLVRGSKSHDNSKLGLVVMAGGNGSIEDCQFWGGGENYPGIGVFNSTASIRDCQVSQAKSQGILFRDQAKGTVEHCRVVTENQVSGIGIGIGSEVRVRDCEIAKNTHCGVWVFEKSKATVEDCILRSNIGPGAMVTQGSTADFVRCIVTGNQGNGLLFQDQSLGSVSPDCRVEGNTQEPYANDGTASVKLPDPPAKPPAPRPLVPTLPKSRIPLVLPTVRKAPTPPVPVQPDGIVAEPDEQIMAELNQLVGLENVKETMRKVRARIKFAKGDLKELDGLHSLFLGGPGTGKTTVAKLMGRILHQMGATRTDKVVVAERNDLVAPFVGQSAERTRKKINTALGGVLFIDEAYALVKKESGQDFGQEVIDTLLPQMEEHRHDLVVIAAGYPARMNDFIDSNPGLKGRFRYQFVFEDYKPPELMQIFDAMLKSRNFAVEESVRPIVLQEFTARYNARDERFDNARMVRNFVNDAHDNLAQRLAGLSARELATAARVFTRADILPLCTSLPPEARPRDQILSELNKLVGLAKIKEHVVNVIEQIEYVKLISERENVPFEKPRLHSLFLGGPGTGKTTVAKLMGEVYRAMGLLSRGHIVAVTDRSEMIGRYVGQTAPLVRTKVKEALGGVLFIDEAYNLVLDEHDSFGREAVGALLTEMENRSGQFVLIAAGYDKEMAAFLNSNSGLKSRFPNDFHFQFDDYSPDELVQIFEGLAARKHLICGPGVKELVEREFSAAWKERGPKFANGRAVRNYFDSLMPKVARRGNKLPKDVPLDVLKTMITEDLQGKQLDRGSTETKQGTHGFAP
jgi:F-box protein 11